MSDYIVTARTSTLEIRVFGLKDGTPFLRIEGVCLRCQRPVTDTTLDARKPLHPAELAEADIAVYDAHVREHHTEA